MDTLWTALEGLPDCRTKKGRRYKLASAAIPPSRLASRPGQGVARTDPPGLARHERVDAGRGRIGTRIIAARSALPARPDTQWKDPAQIVRIERRRELKASCQRQVIHAVTSLARETHGAPELLALARDRWHVESRLFHPRPGRHRARRDVRRRPLPRADRQRPPGPRPSEGRGSRHDQNARLANTPRPRSLRRKPQSRYPHTLEVMN